MKDVLGNHLKDLLFHLVHWLSITLQLRRISRESINLESFTWIVPRTRSQRAGNLEGCQCSTCTETPTQQSATTQDQHHAQGLALCHDVTLDIVTHRWVPAGHPQYTGAREGRLWVAQAQTQLTLFVDPQSISLECEHGSGAEGSKCRTKDPARTQDNAVKPRRVADARVTLNPTRRRRPC